MELEENQLQAEALFEIFRSAIRGLEVAGLTRFTLIDEISKGMGITDLNLAVSTLSEAIKAKESNGGPLPDANKAMVYELLKKLTGGELLAVAKKATAMVNLEDEDSEEYSPRPREIPVVTIEQIKNLQAPRTVHFSGDTKIPEDPDEIKPISAAVTQISPPPTFNKEQPKTAYMLFAEAKRPELQKINPRSTPSELTWHISALWKGMSEQDRKPYVKAAEYDKARCIADNSKRMGDLMTDVAKQKGPNPFDQFKPLSLNDEVQARIIPKEPPMMTPPFKLFQTTSLLPRPIFTASIALQDLRRQFELIAKGAMSGSQPGMMTALPYIMPWADQAAQSIDVTFVPVGLVPAIFRAKFNEILTAELGGDPRGQQCIEPILSWLDQAISMVALTDKEEQSEDSDSSDKEGECTPAQTTRGDAKILSHEDCRQSQPEIFPMQPLPGQSQLIPSLVASIAQKPPVQTTSSGQMAFQNNPFSDQTQHPLSCCCPDCVRAWPKGQEGTVWLTKPDGSSVKTIRLGDDKYQCVACKCSTVIPQTTGLMIPILDWKICDECRLQLPNQSQRPHDDEEEDSDDSDSFDREDEANLQAQLADLKKTMTTADITRAVGPHQTYRHCCPCLYRCHPTDRTMPSALIKECSQNCQCHTATRSIVQEETRARSVVKALYSPLEKNEGCLTAVAGERNCELPGVFSDQGVPLKYLGDGEYESLCYECSYERNPRTSEVERIEKCDLHCGCHQVTVTKEELDAQMDEYQSHGRQCQCPQHYVPADPVTDQDDDRVYFNDYEEEYTEAMKKEEEPVKKPVGLAFDLEGTPSDPIVDGVHVPTKPHEKTGNYQKLCCECLFGYCPTGSGRMFFIQCYDKCCCHQWIKQWGQDKPGRDSEDDSDDEDAIADENSRRFEAYHCAPGRPDCGCRFSGTDFKWMVCQEQCPCHDPDVDCGFQNPHGESF